MGRGRSGRRAGSVWGSQSGSSGFYDDDGEVDDDDGEMGDDNVM